MFKQSSEMFQNPSRDIYNNTLSKRQQQKNGSIAVRDTFVGTPNFLTPEMIERSQSGPFTDLWCLGLIIYTMEMGRLPWKSKNNFERFTEIQAGKIEYPSKMSAEGRSIVKQLMNLNPLKRLGMSAHSGQMDYEVVKAHPFFKGIQFKMLK